MINSLSKDSHITQSCRLQKSTNSSERRVYNSMSNTAPANNSSIIVKKPAEITFSGLSSSKKPFNIYTNGALKHFLRMADEQQPLFNATFSLLLTCLLRPASIMALPSDKKNYDDKKYAATQSIASGIISYIFSQIIFSPIADGMKKILKNPEDFLKESNLLRKSKEAREAGATLVKMVPEAILAAPRAAVTVALIPVVLKYIFGWEKKNNNIHQETTKIVAGGVK